MERNFKQNTHRFNDKINFNTLDHPKVVSSFLSNLQQGLYHKHKKFILDFSKVNPIFPNAAVPIAGLIHYYKNLGIDFTFIDNDGIIESSQILSTIEPTEESQLTNKNTLSKVWRFSNHKSIFWLVNSFLEELRRSDVFENDVLNSIEWCINEIMDNVLNHSNQNTGFVMVQIHKSNKHVAFTVFDYGQGLFNSLKETIHAPRHPLDAITLSVKEGITRDKKVFQGNGMFGMHQIIKNNEGSLSITSNSASYFLKRDKVMTFKDLPTISRKQGCTTVDFQLDYEKKASIAEALKFNNMNHEFHNFLLENLENDKGEILFKIKDKAMGYGTRPSGLRVKNEILNIYKETKKIIIIDFEEIAVISSSFADELIGKLVVEFGFFGFNNIIKLRNMNITVQDIVQRSVSQRMAESLK